MRKKIYVKFEPFSMKIGFKQGSMKQLCERIGCSIELDEGEELVFVEYVAAAKRSFAKRKEKLD